MEKELISVIVPTWNRNELLFEFCTKLLNQEFQDFRLYILDDCSTQKQEKFLPESPKIFYYRSPKNIGQAALRNYGISISKGEIIVCMDDDAHFTHNDAIGRISNYFEATVGCVFFNIEEPEGGILNPTIIDKAEIGNHMTCGCAYKREALLKIGGFNDLFHSYGEETDISLKLIKLGYTLSFAKGIRVFHDYRPSLRSNDWYKRLVKNSTRNDLANVIIHFPLIFVFPYLFLKFFSHLKFSILFRKNKIQSINMNVFGLLEFFQMINKYLKFRKPISLTLFIYWLKVRL